MNKKDLRYSRIEEHGINLKDIFGLESEIDPIELCKKLHRLEKKAHQLAEDYCNAVIECYVYDKEVNSILKKVDKILHYREKGIPLFFNGDPRGYTLKIKEDFINRNHSYIQKDWGGYGIISPEF